MQRTSSRLLIFTALTATILNGQVSDGGFVSLFDGRTLDQWLVHEGHKGHWRAVDGVLDYDGQSEGDRWDKDLYTKRWFRNFVLRFEWRFPGEPEEITDNVFLPDGGFELNTDGSRKRSKHMSAGDSGIYLRGWVGAQVNLWSHPMGSGELHGVFMSMNLPPEHRRAARPAKNVDKPPGQWNSMEIIVVRDRVTVVSNGVTVIDNLQIPQMPYGGPIALQHHGRPVQFRNLHIKEFWPTGPHTLPGQASLGQQTLAKLSDWERGIAVTSPLDDRMKMYLRFYEWNMFHSIRRGVHTSGADDYPRHVSSDQKEAHVISRDMRLDVKAMSDGAKLVLTVTNRSGHDWPTMAAIIPCFNPGPESARNTELANRNTFFFGPQGLTRLIGREIHFAASLREPLEQLSHDRKFIFSDKWPTSDIDAEQGILVRESTSGKWVTAIVWDDFLSAQGHNPWECMHLSVRVGPLERGATKVIQGRIYLLPGNKADFLARHFGSN